jgi:tripeptidyl-peptidase II
MHSANAVHKIEVTTLSQEEVYPAICLKTAVMVLKPAESKITALTARDVVPPGRQIYQNVLKYNLNLAKAQEVALYAPMFYKVLYEAEFESQFWMLFDGNKQLLLTGDAYSNTNYLKLEKGDYVVKLQVRHEKKELLERAAEAVMLANIKLANPLALDIYKSYNQAISNGKKITNVQMPAGLTRSIYVAPLSGEKLTKAAVPAQCSWLEGSLSLAKEEAGRKIDTNVFQYILTEGPAVKKASNGNAKDNGKSKADEHKEALRDFQNCQMAKVDLAQAEEIYKHIVAAHPTFLAVHLSMIQNLDAAEIKNQLPFTFKQSLETKNASGEATVDVAALTAKLKRIVELAELVIKDTDKDALLAYYGLKTDNRPDAAKIKT